MLNQVPEANQPALDSSSLRSLAGWCAWLSGGAAILGIILLVIFFAVGSIYGLLNDITLIVQYTLMLPIALYLYDFLRPYGPTLSLIALAIGLTGMIGIITLQLLLVTGFLPFKEQVVWVIVAFLLVLVWFVLNGTLGRSTTLVPRGNVLTILAGLYFGYPVWSFKLGRGLLEK